MKITILFLCLQAIISLANGAEKDTETLFQNAVKKLAMKDVQAKMTLESTDADGNSVLRKLNVSFAHFENFKKVIIEITAPEDLNGTRILTTDFLDSSRESTIEVFLPSTGKIRKFRANNRRLKIPGTDIPMNYFSSSAFNGYLITDAGQTSINEIDCKKIKLNLPDNNEYLIAYIDIINELMFRIEYYDKKEILTGINEFSEYGSIDSSNAEIIFPRNISVSNPETGNISKLTINHLEALTEIRKTDFNIVPQPKPAE
jgi:hypothetical protein